MEIKLISLLISFSLLGSCNQEERYDLVIHNSQVLDVKSGQLLNGISMAIKDGVFVEISNQKIKALAEKEIDANGRLVTPTFIDAHIHPISEFSDGNYEVVPDTIPKDSLNYYRENLTDGYLPYGTATVLMMGHPDSWTDDFLDWSVNQVSNHVDVYTCGGALATMDENTYKGHFRLNSPEDAKDKVVEYYKKGIKHLKLYWRLKEPELKAVQQAADSLNMKMFSHAGGFFDPGQLTVLEALERGVKNFEHIAILPCSVFDNNDWEIIQMEYQNHFGKVDGEGIQLSLLYILETFRHVEEYKKDEMINLITSLKKADATISTTIGWVYKTYHDTFFEGAKISALNEEQFTRCEKNFEILMGYVKLIHEEGIPIRIASDTAPGGQIVLLEIMLLNQYGISIEDAFKIATINGAEAMGIDDMVGSVDTKKKANFILWDNSPLENANNLTQEMSVFKDGVLSH